MSHWSRRDVLRITAGAATATAIPIAVVGVASSGSSAAPAEAAVAPLTEAELEQSVTGRVMVCVHDARAGTVSLLQGNREKIIQDRQLVARLMRAAKA
ncbi:MAG: hypothetical protein ACR2HP_07610 [Ilumatobacteraceae bacterium]